MFAARTSRIAPLAFATALSSLTASAESAPAVRVAYTADADAAGCPLAPDFVQAVRERLRKATLAQEDSGVLEYRASVRVVGSRFLARLEFTDASGAPRSREVGSATCEDAARALALVTALAIDAGGTSTDDGDGPMTATEALGLVPSTDPAPPEAPQAAPPPLVANRPASLPPDAPRPPPRIDIGIRGTLTLPKGPAVLPGAELFASVRDARGLWLLELGAAGERGWRDDGDAGGARYSFLGARLRGCTLGASLGARFELLPCVVAETGALMAEGFIDNPDTVVDAWFAAGLTGRLSYRGTLGSLQLEAGPLFPINRNRYVFGPVSAPTGVAHEIPPLGVIVALGGALRIF